MKYVIGFVFFCSFQGEKLFPKTDGGSYKNRMYLLYQSVLLNRIWRLMRCLPNDKIKQGAGHFAS